MLYRNCIIGIFLALCAGCATPKVWVLERNENSGVIAYENYDPSDDSNSKIKNLIHCKNFKMTANPIYNVGYEAPSYYVSNNYITPIGGGPIQRGEYHYQCTGELSSSTNDCERNCKDLWGNNALPYGDCVQRKCGK